MEPSLDEALARALRAPDPATLAELAALCRSGRAMAPEERVSCARALLPCADPAVVQLAHDLALQAAASCRDALAVCAAAFDRMRVLRGQPQKFGTARAHDGGPWPVDPATTDSERAKWGLPPLAELLQAADRGAKG